MCLTFALFAAVAFRTSAEQANTPAANASAPDVTKHFYAWYLSELSHEKDPLSDSRKVIESYVSRSLIQEIERKIHSADGLDADYFIKAQDYLDDWLKRVSVDQIAADETSAHVSVTLGSAKESAQHLRVTLVKEKGLWKIRRVDQM